MEAEAPSARQHPTRRLEDTVNQRVRFGIMALLEQAPRRPFLQLRDGLGITDGTLSSHLAVLEGAGYVEIEKGYDGRRPRTWASLTPAGREALAAHLATLRELLAQFDSARAADDSMGAFAFLLAAVLVEGSEAGDETRQEETRMFGYSDLLVREVEGLSVVPGSSGPISRFNETPQFEDPSFVWDDPDGSTSPPWKVPPRSAHGRVQRLLAPFGFRGGYRRSFRGDPAGITNAEVTVTVNELRSPDDAERWLAHEQDAITKLVEHHREGQRRLAPAPAFDDLEGVLSYQLDYIVTKAEAAKLGPVVPWGLQRLVGVVFTAGPFTMQMMLSGLTPRGPRGEARWNDFVRAPVDAELQVVRGADLSQLLAEPA